MHRIKLHRHEVEEGLDFPGDYHVLTQVAAELE